MPEDDRPELVAACALGAVPGIGAAAMARIAASFQGLANALAAGASAIAERAAALRLKKQARAYLSQGPDLAKLGRWAIAAANEAGAQVLLASSEAYPPRLCEVPHPPPVLYVRGMLRALGRSIAVVGSRESDEEGLSIARSLGEGLARAGVQVVSGGARGVDTAAHEGALRAGGPTVAVLGCGIDVVYPPENAKLFEQIVLAGGAVLSEFPPGSPPSAQNFPRRNRTVAGLCDGVVIVRAALRSGALITADHAASFGRPLFAVPGEPGNARAAGPNELIRAGAARPVRSAQDVLQPRRDAAQQTESPPAASKPTLAEEARKIWRLLDETAPVHVDDLARRAQIPIEQALVRLAELEMKGMAVQRPGKYFLRR